MTDIGYENKKDVHQQGLWHKVFGAILYNLEEKTVYFQTIYPKESYTFERDDFIDFAVGGHIEDDEDVLTAGIREIKEELGFDVKTLSELLGHSSVEITLNRYVHSSFEQKREYMKRLNLAF